MINYGLKAFKDFLSTAHFLMGSMFSFEFSFVSDIELLKDDSI